MASWFADAACAPYLAVMSAAAEQVLGGDMATTLHTLNAKALGCESLDIL